MFNCSQVFALCLSIFKVRMIWMIILIRITNILITAFEHFNTLLLCTSWHALIRHSISPFGQQDFLFPLINMESEIPVLNNWKQNLEIFQLGGDNFYCPFFLLLSCTVQSNADHLCLWWDLLRKKANKFVF